MRTRFLNTDCFTVASSSPLQTLSFLNLAVPPPPPPPPLLSSQHHLLSSFSFLPLLHSSHLQFHCLPLQNVISNFLHDLIPHPIHHQIEGFRPDQQPTFAPASFEAPFSQKDEETDKYEHWPKAFPFETPELDVFLENGSINQKEEVQVLSAVAEIANDQDILKPWHKLQCHHEVEDSVDVVENINLDYNMDHSPYSLEDECSVQESLSILHNKFPLFEVEQTNLGVLMQLSIKDELLLLLGIIDSKHWTQNSDLTVNSEELLASAENNMSKILSDHFLMKQCLKFEVAFPDMYLEINFVRIEETRHIKGSSSCCQASSFGSFLSLSSVIFEEYLIVDIDSSQPLEVFFNTQPIHVPEICDWMFGEEMSLKGFDELVVIHELAHIDETFMSLPLPVLCDHEKVRSLYAIVEEIISDITPLSLSASNGIYLDWGLLEKDKSKFKDDSSSQNIEVDYESIDFNLNSFDDGIFFDLLLSNDTTRASSKEGSEKPLNMLDGGNSLVHGSSEVHLSVGNYGCAKPKNEEQLSEVSERASLLFKSMSEFNDLDFFLNRQKATDAVNSEQVVKPFSSNATFSKVLTNDSKAVCADDVEACCIHSQVPDGSFKMESEPGLPHMASFSGVVIVLNTQNFDQEMTVSRRSAYQKVLALEKYGAQVLERDSDLPVDIILGSAICLVWYDCSNIGKKATTQNEASSNLPLYIENIATNVLTLLSFTFSCCTLVFEGDASFLTTVMESSNGLYAAASTLGLKLQLFCSYSSDLTCEIILSSICSSAKFMRGLYPKMPESENLAELFLTKFPSINPLTAHAILSCGSMLIEFLEWTHERRISAIQKYHISDESITLLSALCRYGEREDAKSILTDCSSSVSSGLDSDSCHHKVDSGGKRQKFGRKLLNTDTSEDDLMHFGSVQQFKPSHVTQPFASWMLKDTLTFDDMERPSLYSSDTYGEQQGCDDRIMISCSEVPKTHRSQDYQGSDKAMMENLGWSNVNSPANQVDDSIGAVIDFTDSPLIGEDISCIANSMKFSPSVHEVEKDSARKPKTVRRLSFGHDSHPAFPMAAEINSDSESWSYITKRSSDLGSDGYRDADLYRNKLPSKRHEKPFEEGLAERSTENLQGMPFQDQEALHYCGTPLSNAIHSSHLPQGSPWTMEFLNRIREKSRLRQQSIPCDTFSPYFDQYLGNISKATKRKSPSILDFFKYQGGRTTKRAVPSKRQRHDMKSSTSSRKEKTSPSHFKTWTPVEKRARQTLSFATDENGSQTKLVWSDGKARAMNKKLLNHI